MSVLEDQLDSMADPRHALRGHWSVLERLNMTGMNRLREAAQRFRCRSECARREQLAPSVHVESNPLRVCSREQPARVHVESNSFMQVRLFN